MSFLTSVRLLTDFSISLTVTLKYSYEKMEPTVKIENINPSFSQQPVNVTIVSNQDCNLYSNSQKDLQCPSPQVSPAVETVSTPTYTKLKSLVNDPQARLDIAPARPISATPSEAQPILEHGHTENLGHNTIRNRIIWAERNGSIERIKEPRLCSSLIPASGSSFKAKAPSSNLFNLTNSVHYKELQQQQTSQCAIEGSTLAEEDWTTRTVAFSESDGYKATLCQADDFADVPGNAQNLYSTSKHTRVSKTSPPRKRKNTRVKKNDPDNSKHKRWTESDDDKVVFLREYGNLKWHEVTEFLNGRHTPQAVQMRYLRSLKKRNMSLTLAEKAKLQKIVEEDYENRFKRISILMGPSFTQIRIQKLLLLEAGLGDLLKEDKVWTEEEIATFVDEAAGDLESFKVPYRADRLSNRAADYMKHRMFRSYQDLINQYVGGPGTLYSSLSDNPQ